MTAVSAGQKILADHNNDLDTLVSALTDAWGSYTPVWTGTSGNPSLGNGTLTGAYMQAGSLVAVRIVLTIGSTTTFGAGNYRISLPVGGQIRSLLSAFFFDSSASTRYVGAADILSTSATGDNMRIIQNSTSTTPTTPFTWAANDILTLEGVYEAA